MSDRLRCCPCSKDGTWPRLGDGRSRIPWLHIMDPDGSCYEYCHECSADALDEWAPVAIEAAKHGHEVFFSVLFTRGGRLVSRRLDFDFARIPPKEWAHA